MQFEDKFATYRAFVKATFWMTAICIAILTAMAVFLL